MPPSHSKTERRRQLQRPESPPWRRELYEIIFEADTRAGRWFDIGLLLAILASITVVSLETVPDYAGNVHLGRFFYWTEWVLTFLFTIEYVLRLVCSRHPLRYAFSFWGIIDLLSILPSYVTFFVGRSTRSFVILRSIRLLRVFRVLKLWRMMNDADELAAAVWRVRNKIVVFLAVVLVAVTISGTLMYHIENIGIGGPVASVADGMLADPGADGGTGSGSQETASVSHFTSIPQSMYWAIVTMTTVGYGDIVPQTTAGKMISAILILLGYSLIIVPSTFVSAEFLNQQNSSGTEPPCQTCHAHDQRSDAEFCYRCGERLGEA